MSSTHLSSRLPEQEFSDPSNRWAERASLALSALGGMVDADPAKAGGVPVVKGSRFPVSQLLAELADGSNVQEIAENYELDPELLSSLLHALAVYLNKPSP
jgi:uncharacterized protein (DUF433 family)